MTDRLKDVVDMAVEYGGVLGTEGKKLGYAIAITDALTTIVNHTDIPADLRMILFADLSLLTWDSPRHELASEQHSNINHEAA